jgi:predicted dehydrogenase
MGQGLPQPACHRRRRLYHQNLSSEGTMKRVGIGILSHAHGHANIYCREMQKFADVELVASWDGNPERGRQAGQTFGLEYRANADAVINDPKIDAVIITTETNRHAEFIERVAAAGKHILCR